MKSQKQKDRLPYHCALQREARRPIELNKALTINKIILM